MDLAGAHDTSLLLAAEDVPPVLEDNTAGRSPFLLTSDHYGRAIPRALGDLGLLASEFERHIAWDVGIAGVANALSSFAPRRGRANGRSCWPPSATGAGSPGCSERSRPPARNGMVHPTRTGRS